MRVLSGPYFSEPSGPARDAAKEDGLDRRWVGIALVALTALTLVGEESGFFQIHSGPREELLSQLAFLLFRA